MSLLLVLFLLLLPSAAIPAQTSAAARRAAASITPADVAHRIGIIADDSMMGRDTPSRGLELTAQYVADQFRRFGLRPGGDEGSWLQRYTIARKRLALEQSSVVFSSGSLADSARFTANARYDGGGVPEQPVTGPLVLVSGTQTDATAADPMLRDKLVLYVPGSTAEQGTVQQVIRALYLSRPRALVVLSRPTRPTSR